MLSTVGISPCSGIVSLTAPVFGNWGIGAFSGPLLGHAHKNALTGHSVSNEGNPGSLLFGFEEPLDKSVALPKLNRHGRRRTAWRISSPPWSLAQSRSIAFWEWPSGPTIDAR
jgi:hypothetical protein